MTDSRTIETRAQAEALAELILSVPLPATFSWRDGVNRTASQNNLLHQWFSEIAKHFGDRTMPEVKGQCHLSWGIPIRERDSVFAWTWGRISSGLTFDQKVRYLGRADKVIKVSSGMTRSELSEYMDIISHEYADQGVRLTMPVESS